MKPVLRLGRGQPSHPNRLPARAQTGDDLYVVLSDTEGTGKQLDERLICRSFYRRRSEADADLLWMIVYQFFASAARGDANADESTFTRVRERGHYVSLGGTRRTRPFLGWCHVA